MRRATLDDVDAIAAIHVDAYEASLGDIVDRDVLDGANARRRPLWQALLSEPPEGQAVIVYEVDGELLGFTSAGPSRDAGPEVGVGEVYSLFVDPNRWSVGIGGALLDSALEHLRSLALREARLWVLDRNLRARRFYSERDWRDGGEVRKDARGRFLRYRRSL